MRNLIFAGIAGAGWWLAPAALGAEQREVLPSVVVPGSAETSQPGAYNQPAWARTGRFTSTTDAYVQDPWCPVLDLDYQLTRPRHGHPTHLFTEELELGLPWRLQVAYENQLELKQRRTQVL